MNIYVGIMVSPLLLLFLAKVVGCICLYTVTPLAKDVLDNSEDSNYNRLYIGDMY